MTKPHTHKLHPLPIRIMHWINAVTIFIMVGSGWKIYNDEVIFGWLTFPDWATLGMWAQHGLQWHFFGMWILVTNGLCYLAYGLATGRYRRMLLPIRGREILRTVNDTLHFHLAHEDTTKYNAVQKLMYLFVICVGILIVISGLTLWKPIQFSPMVTFFGSFQNVRLVHFFCMASIVGFIIVHVALALLVPKTLLAMVGGGPVVVDEPTSVEPLHPVAPTHAAG